MSTPVITPDMIAKAKQAQAGIQAMAPPPIVPMTPMSSAPPIIPVSSPNVGVSRTLTDLDKLNAIRDTPYGAATVHNPILHGLAKAGDIAASILAPNVAQYFGGTSVGHARQLGLASQAVQADQANDVQAANLQNIQAQADQRRQQGEKYATQSQAYEPLTLSPELANAAGVPDLAGHTMSQQTYQKLVTAKQGNESKEGIADDKNATSVANTQTRETGATARNAASNSTRSNIAVAADRTRTLVAQMHDSTSRANNVNTNDHKAGAITPDGQPANHKVPADVTKRAALADNVTENANAVDDLLKNHPDIVGSVGGRYTSVQQMIGSDDPAIAELGVRMHNIALASNGAHGVRAQGAIDGTEKELFNHFKSGPNAIHGALNATRSSMQTFLDDEKNFASTGSRTAPKSSPFAAPPTNSDTLTVQIPGQAPGIIHASQKAAFFAKYPNAKEVK